MWNMSMCDLDGVFFVNTGHPCKLMKRNMKHEIYVWFCDGDASYCTERPLNRVTWCCADATEFAHDYLEPFF